MRVFVVPTTQRGEEQKAIELARQKAVDLKTVYLARRYRRISDAYKEGRLDDTAYLRAKKGAEADAASIEKSYFRFAQDIRKLKGYRHTEIISDLTEATLGFLRGKDSFDDSLSIGEAGGYANRQSRDAIQAAWNRNMGQHGMILYAINPKEGGLFSYTLSPDKIQEKILHGKMPPADIVSPRPQETGGRIADFVITRKIEKLGTPELGQAPIAAAGPLPRRIKEVKLKLSTEKVDEKSYLPGVFGDSYRVESARDAGKIVAENLMSPNALRRICELNGMSGEYDKINASVDMPPGTARNNTVYDLTIKKVSGLSYKEFAGRMTGTLFDMSTQASNFAFSKMGFGVVGQASDNFNPQFGLFYGKDLGNGVGFAAGLMRTPLVMTGEHGQKLQIDSDYPYLFFGIGYETKKNGFSLAAVGTAIGKPDKAFTLSKIEFDRNSQNVLAQIYLRKGITTGNRIATGVVGLDVTLGKVWDAGSGKIGVELGGSAYTSAELQDDPKTYRRSLEAVIETGVKAGAYYRGSQAGLNLWFKMNHEVQAAADSYLTIWRGEDSALKLYADYMLKYQHRGPGGYQQSIDTGVSFQTDIIEDKLSLEARAGSKNNIDPRMIDGRLNDQASQSKNYLQVGFRF